MSDDEGPRCEATIKDSEEQCTNPATFQVLRAMTGINSMLCGTHASYYRKNRSSLTHVTVVEL